MTVEELAVICQAHEGIKTGGRNCKFINAAYKLISNKKCTKNQKILTINKYFDTVSNEVLAQILIDKYDRESISGETHTKG
jgi:hypothetical protein